MAFTQEQLNWLAEDNHKIVLIDAEYHNGTELKTAHFSSFPYIMNYQDYFYNLQNKRVDNVSYIDILYSVPSISARIDTSSSIGNLELLNTDGEFDEYISYAWEGHPIKIYIGDKKWTRSEFLLIFDGIIEEFTSPSTSTMNISVRDKRMVLDTPVQDKKLSETYVNTLYTNNSPAFQDLMVDRWKRVISIEVIIAQGMSAVNIANLIKNYLDNIADFSYVQIATGSGGTAVQYNCTATGSVTDATAGNSGFTVDILSQGTPLTTEQVRITCLADSGGNLFGKYLILYAPSHTLYLWFNDENRTATNPVDSILGYIPFLPAIANKLPESNINRNVPVCLGYVFNIEPILIDYYNQVYMVHEGPIEAITDVRVNGVSLDSSQYEVNESIGCFRILTSTSGIQVTCDVIGQSVRTSLADGATYNITLHALNHIIEWLVLEKTSLVLDDICAICFDNVTGFSNLSHIGTYVTEDTTVLSLIDELTNALGGHTRFDRTNNKFQLKQIVDPEQETSVLTIGDDNIVFAGFVINAIETPKHYIDLGYKNNYTVQDKSSLAGLILESPKLVELYSNEYSKVTAEHTDPAIDDKYPIIEEREDILTPLYNLSDAQDEADRRISLRSKKRFIYKIESNATPFSISVGDIINVQHLRYGFTSGKNVLVIGTEDIPTKQKTILEVWA